jgi:aldose 1-epimerase
MYHAHWLTRPTSLAPDDRVVELANDVGDRVEVWPGAGFNLVTWLAITPAGPVNVLLGSPLSDVSVNPIRQGVPILFPFPNRLHAGRWTWRGRDWLLPLNCPQARHAIHGLVCRQAWRVTELHADVNSASVHGETTGDPLWPAPYRLAHLIRLDRTDQASRVTLKTTITATGDAPLPFGLGFHPYFALADFGGADVIVTVPAQAYWQLANFLPTGQVLSVDASRDLRLGKPCRDLQLDDVLTRLREPTCALQHPTKNLQLRIHLSPAFREVVVFTPPHRQAICLEPYTCTTNAANLHMGHADTGWRVLAPGKTEKTKILLEVGAAQG